MLEVKVTVEAEALTNAINKLADAIAGQTGSPVCVPVAPVIPAPVTRAPELTSQVAPVENTVPDVASAPVVQIAPVESAKPDAAPASVEQAAPTTAPAPAPAKKAEESQVTFIALSNAGMVLIDHDKVEEVTAAIQKYGVQSLTDLKPEDYSKLAEDFRALGADI